MLLRQPQPGQKNHIHCRIMSSRDSFQYPSERHTLYCRTAYILVRFSKRASKHLMFRFCIHQIITFVVPLNLCDIQFYFKMKSGPKPHSIYLKITLLYILFDILCTTMFGQGVSGPIRSEQIGNSCSHWSRVLSSIMSNFG